MAETTDPQVTTWANTRVRSLADKAAALNAALVAYKSDYTAQGIAALVNAAGASQVIADGSATDGRPRITGT